MTYEPADIRNYPQLYVVCEHFPGFAHAWLDILNPTLATLQNKLFDNDSHLELICFWSNSRLSDYRQIADEICVMGRVDYKDVEAGHYIVECGLAHFMDLLRLTHHRQWWFPECQVQCSKISSMVTLILLYLDRDADAYNFIKWWATVNHDGRYRWGMPCPAIKGEWLYLTNQDVFEDLCAMTTNEDQLVDVRVPFLIALGLIKSKIVAEWEAARRRFGVFEGAVFKSGNLCQKLCGTVLVLEKIRDFVLPFSAQVTFLWNFTLRDFVSLLSSFLLDTSPPVGN